MTALEQLDSTAEVTGFAQRHLGPRAADSRQMLKYLGYDSLQAFINAVLPESIRSSGDLALPPALSESAALDALRALAARNSVRKSLIGLGYHDTITPTVIQRNVLENPAWYTAYTPYQPEISQGRLEALLNFQTMVADLTAMDIANASMLDEATSAAEAMALARRVAKTSSQRFFVDAQCLPQTIDVLRTRAEPLGIELVVADADRVLREDGFFGGLFQYPGSDGRLRDFTPQVEALRAQGAVAIAAADLLALVLVKPPGQMGFDVVVGNSQRFGVPLGGGGPHAAFMATRERYKRNLPGRLVGVSVDVDGNPAYRLALQTREQHIRREKATSNICTAQVLLAVMAGFYAVYHGPEGLRAIARRVHEMTSGLAASLGARGIFIVNDSWFDTLLICTGEWTSSVHERARALGYNLREVDAEHVTVSLDETCSVEDLQSLLTCFDEASRDTDSAAPITAMGIPPALRRSGAILEHPVFHRYRSETDMLRYLRRLSDRDIALDRSMIPLGSCTMKLNASSEMIPVSWPEFSRLHPFAPADQQAGFAQLVDELEAMLCEITGYSAVSLQPNAGSQGEYAGLLAIRAYYASRGESQRDVCLIPESAHGTNPASAQMCGMRVVIVACDERGNVDLADLRSKCAQHGDRVAAIMVTYPSTHGVFEAGIREVADSVHEAGGQVYVDGANLNAMVGLSRPGEFGGDVSHLNLHKTFCIPHGGGGPGVGPVAVRAHLAEFLPGHRFSKRKSAGRPVSAAPWGSASILPISWMYLRMMGGAGLTRASEMAVLSANYVARRLEPYYPVLYKGQGGLVAHECIVDLRPIRELTGISVDDVAKRLVDYGFHAPTMSFPVAGTLMIEPTESESLEELERFVSAMISIRGEILAVEEGRLPPDDNPLKYAPHTAEMVTASEWTHAYSREEAAYPLQSLRRDKYWPPVRRVDNAYGDRNLSCSCPPLLSYR